MVLFAVVFSAAWAGVIMAIAIATR